MSGFKDMVARDNFGVFLNCDEFAEKRTVKPHTFCGGKSVHEHQKPLPDIPAFPPPEF